METVRNAERDQCLVYRLCPPLSLLLVNKMVSEDVGEWMRRAHNVIRQTIHGPRFVSPCRKFLDICTRSRFILGGSATVQQSLWFLSKMPKVMDDYVRDIVVMPGNLYLNDHGACDDAWWKYGLGRVDEQAILGKEGEDRSIFTGYLRNKFSCLEALALFVPGLETADFYCDYSPHRGLRILQDCKMSSY